MPKPKQATLLDHDPKARRSFDYYPTPAWMTKALMRRVLPFDVLEPCAGEGAITNAIRAEWTQRGLTDERLYKVLSNDLDLSRPSELHLDATQPAAWERMTAGKPYWGITNVPFELADQIVPLAVQYLPVFATILRLSWLEPTAARQRFLAAHPPRTLIVLPRHDWRGTGSTDSVTSAWFIWEQGRSSTTRGIEVVTKDERDELQAGA